MYRNLHRAVPVHGQLRLSRLRIFFLSNEWQCLICVHTWSCNQNQSKAAVQFTVWMVSRVGFVMKFHLGYMDASCAVIRPSVSPQVCTSAARGVHSSLCWSSGNCANKCSQIQKSMTRGSTSTTENGPGRSQILDPWDALAYRRPNIQNTEETRFWGTLRSTPTPRLPVLSTISYYIPNLIICIIYSTKQ